MDQSWTGRKTRPESMSPSSREVGPAKNGMNENERGNEDPQENPTGRSRPQVRCTSFASKIGGAVLSLAKSSNRTSNIYSKIRTMIGQSGSRFCYLLWGNLEFEKKASQHDNAQLS